MIKKTIIIFLLFLSITALCGCTDLLYEIFGESMADELMSKIDAESAIKEDFSKITEIAESVAHEWFSSDYAPYDPSWVDYREQTNDPYRLACLKKAEQMVTVIWTAPFDFVTWRASDGSLNSTKSRSGERSNGKFKSGETYVGVPYSMKNNKYDDIDWLEFLEGDINVSDLEAVYYAGKGNGTAKGIDCGYFVYTAIKASNSGTYVEHESTKTTFYNSKYYSEIPGGFKDMKPGDIVVKNNGSWGHMRLFVGINRSNGKYAFFEAAATNSKCDYFEYTEENLKGEGYKAFRFRGFD